MIPRFRRRVVSIALLLGLALSSHAEVTNSQYDNIKDNEAFHGYIMGVMSGYSWANADLAREGKPQLFCQPDHVRMTKEQVLELIDWKLSAVRANPRFLALSPKVQASWSIPLVLTSALKERYPCSGISSAPIQQSPPVAQPAPVYQPAPLPVAPTVSFPSAPGRTTAICRTLSNGTIVCD